METTPLRPIRKILVGTGLTTESVGAVLVSQELARLFNAELHLVHAIEPISALQERAIPGLSGTHEQQTRDELAQFAERHGIREPPRLHVVRGAPEREILALRAELKADLLVIGRYGKGGLKRGILGSIAHHLVRKCPVSTLIVEPEFRGRFGKLAVASDMDEDSYLEIARAMELADRLGIPELHVLTAYTVPPGFHSIMSVEEASQRMEQVTRERAKEVIEQVERDFPGSARFTLHVAEGSPGKRVPELAAELGIDLLVLSTHYRSRSVGLLLGRTTEAILNDIACSVWSETSPKLVQGLADVIKSLLD